jgi:hypothetical protein
VVAAEFEPGIISFTGTASAGDAIFTLEPPPRSGEFNQGGNVNFFGQSTADQAVFMVVGPHTGKSSGGILTFNDDSSAGNATINSFGGSRGGFDARVLFNGNSTADHCTYIGDGAVGGGGQPGSTDLEFFEQASAGSGTFILNGSEFRSSYGAQAFFNDDSNAADGTFILNGGTNGGFGAEAIGSSVVRRWKESVRTSVLPNKSAEMSAAVLVAHLLTGTCSERPFDRDILGWQLAGRNQPLDHQCNALFGIST